jgi:hypothetical protein
VEQGLDRSEFSGTLGVTMQQIVVFYGFGPLNTDKLAQSGVSVTDFERILKDVCKDGIKPIELFTSNGRYASQSYLFFGSLLRAPFGEETVCTPFSAPCEEGMKDAKMALCRLISHLNELNIELDPYVREVAPRVAYTDGFGFVDCEIHICAARYADKVEELTNALPLAAK